MAAQPTIRVYAVELTVEEPLHVGAGATGNMLELLRIPAVLAANTSHTHVVHGLPIIPRSTLKGVLRSVAERIAHSVCKARRSSIPWRIACYHHQATASELEARRRVRLGRVNLLKLPLLHTPQGQADPGKLFNLRPLSRAGVDVLVPAFDNELARLVEAYVNQLAVRIQRLQRIRVLEEGGDRVYEELASLLCPVCRLFGSPLLGGAVKLTDLLPYGDRNTLPTVARRAHVGIERARGVRKAQLLYEVEYLTPGTRFRGYMVVADRVGLWLALKGELKDLMDDAWKAAQELLDITIRYVQEEPVKLGGHKTRGYGYVKIRIREV